MDYSARAVLLIFMSSWYRSSVDECVAVNINKLDVPPLVPIGVESMVLDCDYSLGEVSRNSGLVVKWFFNQRNLVYQWIPPLRPQVIGILKDKVDKDFRISEDPLQAHRAIRVLRPSTDLSGNYTCVVSTFMEEDRRTQHMLVYSTGKSFNFIQEKKYVFLVTLICVAEELYPRPEMAILSRGEPLKQTETEVNMDSWGLYSVTSSAVVHDDDVTGPFEVFLCILRLPPANFEANRTTVYYPGLMPTAQVAAVEVIDKAQEHNSNSNHAVISRLDSSYLLLSFIIWSYFYA